MALTNSILPQAHRIGKFSLQNRAAIQWILAQPIPRKTDVSTPMGL